MAATNRNLEEMIKKGEFREDLFYRLNVLPIFLPPLRERKNDIESWPSYFIDKFNQEHHKNITGSPRGDGAAEGHIWPGNIRELENVIEHAFVIETDERDHPPSLPETIAVLRSLPVTRARPDDARTSRSRATRSERPGPTRSPTAVAMIAMGSIRRPA